MGGARRPQILRARTFAPRLLTVVVVAVLVACDGPGSSNSREWSPARLSELRGSAFLTAGERREIATLGERQATDRWNADDQLRLTRLATRHDQALALKSSPWGRRAVAEASRVEAALLERFAGADAELRRLLAEATDPRVVGQLESLLAEPPPASVSVHVARPWALVVTAPRPDDPVAVARRVGQALRRVGGDVAPYGIAPKDDDATLVVVVFRDETEYRRLGASTVAGTRRAHTEETTGWLLLPGDADLTTVRHEGVHQLMLSSSPALAPAPSRSFWIHEGFAEWIAGTPDANGTPRPRRIARSTFETIRSLRFRGAAMDLRELVGCTYFAPRTFRRTAPEKIDALYAQGTLLVHFLETFARSAGRVRLDPDVVGTYRRRFRALLTAERAGESGPGAFRRHVAPTDGGFERLASLYERYEAWALGKVLDRGHFRNGRLLPFEEAGGRPADDRLDP